jgi:hypothetical protein
MIKIYHISQLKKTHSSIIRWYGLSRNWEEARKAALAVLKPKWG